MIMRFPGALCVFVATVSALAGCGATDTGSPARETIARIEPSTQSSVDGYEAAPQNEFGFLEAHQQGPDLFGSQDPPARVEVQRLQTPGPIEAAQPTMARVEPQQQIAYSYGYGFRVSSAKIAELQQAHIGLCEALASGCRILRTSRANGDSWDGYGELRMQVEAPLAVRFGSGLAAPAEALGGELVSSVRDGVNLTEQIIDSEARLTSRLILRDKLTAILQGNRGSVDELVKAEKAVADVNMEIDITRSTLARLRNQVAFSDVNIEYEPQFGETQLGFAKPVMTALRSIGTTFGMAIAVLIYAIVALVPVVVAILALRWVLHHFGLRFRFWRRDPHPASLQE